MKKALLPLICLLVLAACNNNTNDAGSTTGPETAPPIIGYTVVNTYPHDTSFFTEGLEFYEGQLYEASGSGSVQGDTGEPPYPSAFGVVNLKTGQVDKKAVLDAKAYFGEGVTFLNGKVYQLTYTTGKGFIYDAKSFKKLQEFSYAGEGWSLTHDSSKIFMSDGSSNLRVINPATINGALKAESIVGVSDNKGPVANVNELEYVDGYIYANVWQSNNILKIDPSNGKVVGKLDLSNLATDAKRKYPGADVLNGIAYNPATKSFFITGKLWPTIYEIKLN